MKIETPRVPHGEGAVIAVVVCIAKHL